MFDFLKLGGKRVLVTGASSGLGRATALLLDQLGAEVILSGRDPQRLEQTAALCGGKAIVRPFDLEKLDEIPPWLKEIAEQGGPLSGLVHSAGVQLTRPLRMLASSQFEQLWRVNVGAAAMLTKGFRQKQVRAEWGAVVLVSSVMGLTGAPGVSAYAATKGAVASMTRALALELAPEKIRVNSVAPGHVKTEMAERVEQLLTPQQIAAIEAMHPLGLGQPADVAQAIAFLLSEASRWITGTTLVVDGGYTAH